MPRSKGRTFGSSWVVLGRSWGGAGGSQERLGEILGGVEEILEQLFEQSDVRPLFGDLGGLLGRSWALLGSSGEGTRCPKDAIWGASQNGD